MVVSSLRLTDCLCLSDLALVARQMAMDVAEAALAHGGKVPPHVASLEELAPAVNWMLQAGVVQDGVLHQTFVTVKTTVSTPALATSECESRVAIAHYLKQSGWRPIKSSIREASIKHKIFNPASILEYHQLLRKHVAQLEEYAGKYRFEHGASKGYYAVLLLYFASDSAWPDFYVPPKQKAEFYKALQDFLRDKGPDPRIPLNLLQPQRRARKRKANLDDAGAGALSDDEPAESDSVGMGDDTDENEAALEEQPQEDDSADDAQDAVCNVGDAQLGVACPDGAPGTDGIPAHEAEAVTQPTSDIEDDGSQAGVLQAAVVGSPPPDDSANLLSLLSANRAAAAP